MKLDFGTRILGESVVELGEFKEEHALKTGIEEEIEESSS